MPPVKGKFPISFQRELPPKQSGAVRANIDVNTGAGAMGRSLQQAGGQLFEFGMNKLEEIQKSENDLEFSKGKMDMSFLMTTALEKMKMTDDPATHESIRQSVFEQLKQRAGAGTNKKIQDGLLISANQMMASFNSAASNIAIKNRLDRVEADAWSNLDSSIEAVDIEGYKRSVAILNQYNRISETRANELLEDMDMRFVFSKAALMADSDPEQASQIVDMFKPRNVRQAEATAKMERQLRPLVANVKKKRFAEWENDYYKAINDGESLEELGRRRESARQAGIITEKQFHKFEGGGTKAGEAYLAKKQRVNQILGGETKGEFASSDEIALIGAAADLGFVTVSRTGPNIDDFALSEITNPKALAEFYQPGNYIPKQVQNMISQRAVSEDTNDVANSILTFKYIEDAMPEKAEIAMSKMSEVARIRLGAVELTAEDLSDPEGAQDQIKADMSRVMRMEAPNTTKEQDYSFLYGTLTDKELKLGIKIDESWAATRAKQQIESEVLEGALSRFHKEGKSAWNPLDPNRRIGTMPIEMLNFYTGVARQKYRELIGRQVPQGIAKTDAHNHALKMSLVHYRPIVWSDRIEFVEGVNEDLKTGFDTGFDFSHAINTEYGEHITNSHEPSWSKKHDAYVLMSTSAPYDAFRNNEGQLVTWRPDRSPSVVEVAVDDAEFPSSQPSSKSEGARQFRLLQEAQQKFEAGDVDSVRNDPRYSSVNWTEENKATLKRMYLNAKQKQQPK